ncbi:TonB-dependent receptor [Haliangium sp.]|uniref:TonB-dependent receptor n=1 Tax=Haliangium sp. TaxID=2663208 RepID=UPI003D136759
MHRLRLWTFAHIVALGATLTIAATGAQAEPQVRPADEDASVTAAAPAPAAAVGIVRGRVVDAATGEPVPGAFVGAGPVADITGPDGRFAIEGVALGTLEITAAADLYAPVVLSLELTAGVPIADVAIELAPDTAGAGEVVEVVGEAPDLAEAPEYELAGADIKVLPGSGNDALKALQSLPGVARVPFGLGGLVLRGSAPRDTNVYLDGVEVPLLYHFGGLASFYPSSMLDSLEMVPGGFSSEYGRAQGGVVLLRSRAGRRDRWRIESEVSLTDAAVRADGPGPLGGAWSLGLRRSYVDAVLALALPEDGAFSLTLAPRYYDGQLRYDLDLGRGQRVSAMIFGSDDRLQFLFEDEDEMDTDTFRYVQRFVRAAVRWERRSADWQLAMTPWVGWDESTIRFTEEGITRESTPMGARFDLTRSFDRGYLAGGVDVQGGRFWYDINNEPPPMPDMADGGDRPIQRAGAEWIADTALWMEGLIRLWDDRLSVKPGLRFERYDLTDEWALDPRLNLAQSVSPGITLRQSVGLYHQPPVPADVDPLFGNEDLGSSYALQTSAGVEAKLPLGPVALEASATAFFDQVYELPVDVVSSATGAADPGSPLAGGAGATSREFTSEQFGTYSYQENVGKGRNYGVETLVRGRGGEADRAGSWLGWVSYTYSRALRRYDPARFSGYYPYVLDQPHVLTALGSVLVTDHWRLGARVRYVSGNPITPVVGSYFDADAQEYRAVSGELLGDRLPAFFQLDLRIDRTWRRSWGSLSLFLDIQNLTNRVNPEGVRYSFDFSQQAYTRGLPIFPSLGLEYRP